MDPITALSLACNVLAVVDFGTKTAGLFIKLKKGSLDPDLSSNAARLETLSEELEKSITNTTPVLQSTHARSQQELLSVARNSATASTNLLSELNKISSSRGGVVGKVARALKSSSKLKQLEKVMLQFQQDLQSRLIKDIWDGQAAARVKQQDGFSKLENDLQASLLKFSEGNLRVEDLLKSGMAKLLASLTTDMDTMKRLILSENAETRGYVDSQHCETRQHVIAVQESFKDTLRTEGQLRQLRQSLLFNTINARQSNIDESYPDTFNWIFESNEEPNSFKEWLTSDNPIFWVNGKPGSGKSTLMKFLIKDTRTLKHLPNYAIYSFFVWNSGDPMQKSRKGMFCSLLHQMLERNDGYTHQTVQDFPDLLRKTNPHDWGLQELESTFKYVLDRHEQPVCFFIDGLDELENQENGFALEEIVSGTSNRAHTLKLCVSSRPEPIWTALLSGYPSLKLEDLTRVDRQIVARELLEKYFEVLLREESKRDINQLVSLLVEKSSGVFLWLYLALNSIRRGLFKYDTLDELQKRIDELPSELTNLYQRMWLRLGDDASAYQKEAAKYFRFLIEWYERPPFPHRYHDDVDLTSFHLALSWDSSLREKVYRERKAFVQSQEFVNACRTIQKRVETRCAGLLEFSGSSEHYIYPNGFRLLIHVDGMDPRILRVNFIHRTAKDFLLRTDEGHRLIRNCPIDSARIAVLRALLCDVWVIPGSTFRQGFSGEWFRVDNGNVFAWSDLELDRHSRLRHILQRCQELQQSYSAIWETISTETCRLVEEAFEERAMTNFHETAAGAGLIRPIHTLIASRNKGGFPCKSLLSYLAGQRERFISFVDVDDQFMQWATEKGVDPDWRDIHATEFAGQGIPLLLPFWEVQLKITYERSNKFPMFRRRYDSMLHWLYNNMEAVRQQTCCPHRKLFLHFKLFDSHIYYNDDERGIKMHVAGTDMHSSTYFNRKRLTDIIVQVNRQQLFNDVITRALIGANTPWDHSNSTDDINIHKEKMAELRQIMYLPEQCHREIILVGNFSNQLEKLRGAPTLSKFFKMSPPESQQFTSTMSRAYFSDSEQHSSGSEQDSMANIDGGSSSGKRVSSREFFVPSNARYSVPTNEQSSLLLGMLDKILGMELREEDTEDQVDALQDSVESVLATGENRIVDIAETLRQKGHFIPSEEKIDEFINSRDLDTRVRIMDELNRECQAWTSLS